MPRILNLGHRTPKLHGQIRARKRAQDAEIPTTPGDQQEDWCWRFNHVREVRFLPFNYSFPFRLFILVLGTGIVRQSWTFFFITFFFWFWLRCDMLVIRIWMQSRLMALPRSLRSFTGLWRRRIWLQGRRGWFGWRLWVGLSRGCEAGDDIDFRTITCK